jgi:hypothetical protein
VPGIASIDPTVVVEPNGSGLTQLFLGGKSMVQKALDAQPTFATVWVGNNDVLSFALNGFPAGATPVNTFIANYSKMINQLMAGAPNLKGVLIGVVQVAGAPILFQAGLINASPAVQGAATQIAGRPVTLDPTTCAGANAGRSSRSPISPPSATARPLRAARSTVRRSSAAAPLIQVTPASSTSPSRRASRR